MTPATGRDVVRVTAGVAALGGGIIDAALIGPYAGRGSAPGVLAVLAVVGLASGIALIVRPVRSVVTAVVVAHLVVVAGWIAARVGTVPLVAGLDRRAALAYPEIVAAGFSAVVVIAGTVLWRGPRRSSLPAGVATAVLVPVVAVFVMFGGPAAYLGATTARTATAAGSAGSSGAASATTPPVHVHDATGGSGSASAAGATGHEHHHVTARPFDPTKPIDLSGTAGVTMVQQKQAELLLAQTLAELPRYADPAVAERAGYQSIGDSMTGDEHLINWSYINDTHVLDPNFPESLVYDTKGGAPKLEAAMFIMPDGFTLDNVPDLGGALIQWHVHDNLCFTGGDDPQVAGVNFGGTCPAGTSLFQPHPMIHVWITSNPCGPFAALEGVGAGQTKDGTRSCDHVHGAPSADGSSSGGPLF